VYLNPSLLLNLTPYDKIFDGVQDKVRMEDKRRRVEQREAEAEKKGKGSARKKKKEKVSACV
jgi:hypothetical protein